MLVVSQRSDSVAGSQCDMAADHCIAVKLGRVARLGSACWAGEGAPPLRFRQDAANRLAPLARQGVQ